MSYGEMDRGESGEPDPGRSRDYGLAAGFVVLLLSLLLLYGGWRYASNLPYFRLTAVEITGETEFTDIEAMRSAILGAVEPNYFAADLDKARETASSFPWVESARVERVWHGTLRVRIARRRAAAIWCGARLLSDAGEIFAPESIEVPEAAGLPLLSGPDSMAPRAAVMYRALLRSVERLDARIVSLDVTERGSWSLAMEGPDMPLTRVVFGRESGESSVPERMALVAAHYDEVSRMMGGAPPVIDARYEGAFAAVVPEPPEDEVAAAIAGEQKKSAGNEGPAKRIPSQGTGGAGKKTKPAV